MPSFRRQLQSQALTNFIPTTACNCDTYLRRRTNEYQQQQSWLHGPCNYSRAPARRCHSRMLPLSQKGTAYFLHACLNRDTHIQCNTLRNKCAGNDSRAQFSRAATTHASQDPILSPNCRPKSLKQAASTSERPFPLSAAKSTASYGSETPQESGRSRSGQG